MDEEAARLERERKEIEALKAQMEAEEAALQREQEMLLAEQTQEALAAATPLAAPGGSLPSSDAEEAARLERERKEIEALKAQMEAEEAALAETRLAAMHESASGPGATPEEVTVADVAEARHRLRDHWLPEGDVGDQDQGETVHDSVGKVVMRDSSGALVAGWLVLTSYRVVFLPRDSSMPLTTVMLSAIEEIEPFGELPTEHPGFSHKYAHIRLRAKDARALYFIRDDDLSDIISRNKNTLLTEIADIMRFQGGGSEGGGRKRFLSKLKVPGQADEAAMMSSELNRLTQFHVKAAAQVQAQSGEAVGGDDSPYLKPPAESDARGLGYFDMKADFIRMGVGTDQSNWRLTTVNDTFSLCSTYPQVLATPKIIKDTDLVEVAKFRSKQRIPVLTWINPDTHAAIVRCAQPLVGLVSHHSQADEDLFKTISLNNTSAGGILVADARPYANAVANKGRKGGFEDVSKYEEHTELIFLNIDNIHVMRRSLQDMHELVRAPDRTQAAGLSDVLATGWLSYVGRLLGGAAKMVETVGTQHRTVIVHCSDGWDRTAQLSGLAQLCLDPYYRTCRGFQVLFQKEWLGFGHKCRDRTWGHKLHERSPIMMQFLDAVHQVMYDFPEAFEFNEMLLIKIVDAIVTNSYSDFRFNNERERLESLNGASTTATGSSLGKDVRACPSASLWHILHDDTTAGEYRNSRYDAAAFQGAIRPPLHARVWTAYFNRWICDPIGGRPSKLLGIDTTVPAASTEGSTISLQLPEMTPRYHGWMWKEGKRHKEFKKRYFVLYDLMPSEAALVYYYQEEKSGALVPKGMIALRQGAYEIGKPKRARAGFEHAFRLDVALPHSTSHSTADKATGTMRALMHRGSGSHSGDSDGAAPDSTASGTAKSKKKSLFPGKRRSTEDDAAGSWTDATLDAAPVPPGLFSTAGDSAAASVPPSEFGSKKTMKYILAPETKAAEEMWLRELDPAVGTTWADTQEETSSDSEEDDAGEGANEQVSGLKAVARGLRAGVRRMSNKGAEDAAAAAAAAMFAEAEGAGGDYTGLSEGIPPATTHRVLRSSRAPDPEDYEHTSDCDVEASLLEKMETRLENDEDDEEGAQADLVAFESLRSPSRSATATADALRLRLSTRVLPSGHE